MMQLATSKILSGSESPGDYKLFNGKSVYMVYSVVLEPTHI